MGALILGVSLSTKCQNTSSKITSKLAAECIRALLLLKASSSHARRRTPRIRRGLTVKGPNQLGVVPREMLDKRERERESSSAIYVLCALVI